MFFDTHLHLIYPDRLDYPWLENVPALNRPNTIEDYISVARRLGITDCLHMEVDVADASIRDETVMVQDMMAVKNSPIRGAISACRPERNDFAQFVELAQSSPTIRGFRRVLHAVPDGVSQTQVFRENIQRLSGTGLTFDLCVRPDQLSIAGSLVDHCPDVIFILDHCGVPDILGGVYTSWAEGLSELAKRPNVTGKISGLIAYADPDTWGLDDIRPYFDYTVSSFGHNRIIWGSDSPVCNLGGGLESWVAATHALTQNWSASDRAALFRDNAHGVWNTE